MMKTKETVNSKNVQDKTIPAKTKAQSLRPMRSMVAVRSFKPKTTVAAVMVKPEASAQA